LSIVYVVNRTTRSLDFLFDGVPGQVAPGYKRTDSGEVIPAGRDLQPLTVPLPKTMAEYARRQNVQMGSEDKDSGELVLLIGVGIRDEEGNLSADPHWVMNDISHVEQGRSSERLKRSSLDEKARRGVEVPTSGFPRGRAGASDAPFEYSDGPVSTDRGV
jgi:hypothetical protein